VRRVKLGNSDVEVSALAFGTDLIGSKIDRRRSFELLDFYREQGGNFLDTANFYASWLPGCQGGESETTIGLWMKERGNRQEIVVSTKLAFDYPGSAGGLSSAEIRQECDKSLKRLQTDVIDVYQAHRDDQNTPLEETMEAFDSLVTAGKIRLLGASNLPLWRIAEANTMSRIRSWHGYSVVEQRYTYLRPRHGADFGPQIFISEDVKQYAKIYGITLVGYSVLLQGAYLRADREIPAQFGGTDTESRLAALREVSREAACTAGQTILAWMRQSTPSILPIIAGSRIEQIRENVAALDVMLTSDQMRRLDEAGNPVIKQAWLQPS
jgi:aryl-alcohol dehydrogenase-like predicted oxidoreductase